MKYVIRDKATGYYAKATQTGWLFNSRNINDAYQFNEPTYAASIIRGLNLSREEIKELGIFEIEIKVREIKEVTSEAYK